MKIIGWTFAALFAFTMLVGVFRGVARERDRTQAATDTPAPAPVPVQAQPAIEIRAEELAQLYDQNEVAADDRFRGKRLLVTGALTQIRKDFTDDIVLQLKARGLMGVQARVIPEQKGAVAQLRNGQEITLDCECRGATLGAPSLWGCTLH